MDIKAKNGRFVRNYMLSFAHKLTSVKGQGTRRSKVSHPSVL